MAIKTVLVEDSAVALKILKDLLDSSTEVEVVGTAQDGASAIPIIESTDPDVICTDLEMPRMDGLEFTKTIMAKNPKPILVVSNAVHPSDVDNIFDLMKAGALDFFPKPTSGSSMDYQKLKDALVMKIRTLAAKRV